MKITVSIDSLKGSLSSMEAGEAIRQGILLADPEADVIVRPLADGGEGTVEALTCGSQGHQEQLQVTGPLGDPVQSSYGILDGSGTAVIEMASAAGITLVSDAQRNPLNTTTYGVGELIRDAIGKGCRQFIVGIGGSATNDGGLGMLQALGYEFLDDRGKPVSMFGRDLEHIASVSDTNVMPELAQCRFRIACDVTNPLCGPNGCSSIYGPQKGATAEIIAEMDDWLSKFSKITAKWNPKADAETPGAGAAGGLGFAFLAFTNAELRSGIQIVLEETRLEDSIRSSDLVVTGEGRLDRQTVMGKAPSGVAELAKKYGKPVIAFSGIVSPDAGECNEHGIDAYFPILRRVVSLEDAMDPETAARNMTETVEQVFRLIRTIRSSEV